MPTPTMQPVYNLTVEGAHCYYANGVLVHNCDTVSQALKHMREIGMLTRSAERLAEIDRDTAYDNVRQPRPLYSV